MQSPFEIGYCRQILADSVRRLLSLTLFCSFVAPQPFQTASQEAALALVSSSPEFANQLQQSYQQLFGAFTTVSAVSQSYTGDDKLALNTDCANIVATTIDASDAVLQKMATIEQYIHLTVPRMEDGGNWGVGVQLAAIKIIQDARTKMDASVDELYKYAATRADALEKLKLPSKSATKTTTSSTSESKGQDKEKGETGTTTSSENTETKTTETSSESPEANLRRAALTAVDVRYYTKAKATFQLTITTFLAVVDFVDKNQLKIKKPQGESGVRGYSNTMY